VIDWSGGLNIFYRKQVVAVALSVSAKACSITVGDLALGKRKAPVAFARQLAMYLCHVVADMSLRDIAEAFERDRTTVSHACHAVEDRRECPIYDRQVEHLEDEFRRRIRDMINGAVQSPAPWEQKQFRLTA
jgi:chromosomal replication initiation ATPase DnaA